MRGRRFEALMLVLCAILVVGGHVLVWADNNGLVAGNEIFSVWALPLYVGFGLAGYLLLLWWIGRRPAPVGVERQEFPAAYWPSLIGAGVFIVAVIVELASRAISGSLPSGPESVLSPARIALFAAALLLLSGPITSIVTRLHDGAPDERRRSDSVLLSVGLGLALSVATLLTGFVHPFVVEAGATTGESDAPIQTTTDLYRIPIDGSGGTRLTTTPDEYEVHPDVSPDGTRIAFARGAPDNYRIYTMTANGADARRLTTLDVHEDGPLWIPGADTISYVSPVITTTTAASTSAPAPAPRPSANSKPVDLTGLGTWTVGSAGGPPRLVSSRGGEGVESWAADGDTYCGWIYESGSFDVASGAAATRTRTSLASGPAEEWSCTLSGDGTRVAFHSDRDGDFEIYSVATDGSDLRQLTDDPGIDQLPRYSPDGSRLAFISSRTGEFELYVANADMSDLRNVSNDPALDDGFLGLGWLPDGSGLVAASSGRTYPSPSSEQTIPLGVASLALQAMLLALALTLAFRIDPDTTGPAVVIGIINGVLAALVSGELLFALAPILAGLAVDAVVTRFPDLRGVSLSLVVAAVASAVFVVSYFIILFLLRGIAWSWDLVLGSSILAIALATAVGVLASGRDEEVEAATIN